MRIRLQDNNLYAGLTEALHIYRGLTSTLPAKEFTTDDFKAAVSEGFDLTSLVTAPELWADPVTAFTAQEQYTGAVAWKGSDGETAVTGVFAAGTAYKAVVTLLATTGYTFIGVAENSFAYSGAEEVVNSADSGVVTITFPATAAGTVSSVTVNEGSISLAQGGGKTFTATVSGNPTPPQTVIWTVEGNDDA